MVEHVVEKLYKSFVVGLSMIEFNKFFPCQGNWE
jgi:hypothetical protein